MENYIKLIKNIGIILILATFVINADACDYPQVLKTGATVECDGVILSSEQFLEASNQKKELRLKNLKIAEYEGLEELYEMRHKHYKRELADTKSELKWLQIKSTAGYVISFSLGAVIMGVVAKEVLK